MNKDIFAEQSALVAQNISNKHLSDNDYMRIATRISIMCNIEKRMEDYDDKYRIDFYLKNSVIESEYIDEWLYLLRASDMHTMTVVRSNPPTIRVSCYRLKR